MADAPHPTEPSFLEGQRLLRRAVNPPVRMVLTHWLGLHEDGRMPERGQFHPADLPSRALPYLFLLERIDADQWRIRLLGSHIVDALGKDLTGRTLEDEQIPGISESRTVRLLRRVEATGLPGHFHGRSGFRFQEGYADHEQVLLPFRRHDAAGFDQMLGVIVYEGLQAGFGPAAVW